MKIKGELKILIWLAIVISVIVCGCFLIVSTIALSVLSEVVASTPVPPEIFSLKNMFENISLVSGAIIIFLGGVSLGYAVSDIVKK